MAPPTARMATHCGMCAARLRLTLCVRRYDVDAGRHTRAPRGTRTSTSKSLYKGARGAHGHVACSNVGPAVTV